MTLKAMTLVGAMLVFPLVALAASPRPMASPAANDLPAGPAVSAGLSFGASGGLGGEGDIHFDRLAQGLPVTARFAVGYRVLDPGKPLDARHVFINANDNGTPEEHGSRWDVRLDALYATRWGNGWKLYGGPRFSMFTGNFKFVGGNEFFDVTSHQWGIGAGLESGYPISPRTSLEVSAGLDYYFDGYFESHDTRYNADGSSISPVDEYTYADADAAINQPTWSPRFTVGLGYRFGR